MSDETKEESNYTAENIEVLKGLAGVRYRPSMYIGNVEDGTGLHQCLEETISNAVDEFLAGFCDEINVVLYDDNSVSVEDNGRGIPVDIHEGEGKSALTVVLTQLHAGGKFNKDSYKISAGLHGVGVSAVNALSKYMKAEVYRDGFKWVQEFEKGEPKGDVKKIGPSTKRGTKITFQPDEEIFPKNNKFNPKIILNRCAELSFLNVGLSIIFKDKINNQEYTFKDKDGLGTFIKKLNEKKEPINKDIIMLSLSQDGSTVDLALQWTNSQSENILCYTNTVHNNDGGTHLQGFRSGINKAINKINDDKKWVRGIKDGIKIDDTLSGLTAIISIKIPEPAFESQTKNKLINSEVKTLVDYVINEGLYQFFDEHPKIGHSIVSRIALSAKAREAARRARDAVLKTNDEFSSIGILPGKLADCSSKDPNERALILTEGESASGTMKSIRDRRTIALLPLRGKILNVEKAKPERIFENEEIKNIFISLGITMNKDGEVDCSNIRFKTIVIACDADPDGNSIRCLLLTLFFRFMRPVIENGYLYIAQPPLYRVMYKKERLYIKDENELNSFKSKHKGENFSYNFFKGLGEMGTDDLFTTMLDPKKRIWKKVTINDFDETDSTVSLLMGPEVPPRAEWISQNATYARNIDI